MIKWANQCKASENSTWAHIKLSIIISLLLLLLLLLHVLQIKEAKKLSFLVPPPSISTSRFLHLPLIKPVLLPSLPLWSYCYSFHGHFP